MRIICADNRPGVGVIRGSVAEDNVFKPNTKVYLAHREPFVQNLETPSAQKTDIDAQRAELALSKAMTRLKAANK